jgi:hypothetical protein
MAGLADASAASGAAQMRSSWSVDGQRLYQWSRQSPGTGRRALTFAAAPTCRYCPPSPNASPTAVIPAVSAKGKLKITSSAPASM